MLVRSSRPPAATRLGTHRVSRLFAGVPSSFPGHPCFSPASHPSHCLKLFGGCAATSPSLRSLNLCLSLGDDHDSSEAVEGHGRGHGKGPCDAIGAILKRHASTSAPSSSGGGESFNPTIGLSGRSRLTAWRVDEGFNPTIGPSRGLTTRG